MVDKTEELHIGRVASKRLATAPTPGGHPMEVWISHVLRIGVIVAGGIIALGLSLLIINGPGGGQPDTLHALRARGGQAFALRPQAILHGVLAGQATAIIQLGLLALILTPIARVAMTVGLFGVQRDRTFILITLVVLAILVLGLAGIGS